MQFIAPDKLISTLDLKSGYWQISVAPEDQYKTAFNCHKSLFELKQMSFELANASWTNQCCFVSIDDIITNSRNAAEHNYHHRFVSERLSEVGMKMKPDDGKQKSMTYSSESENSEHSLQEV